MIFKFKSKATGDLIMLEPIGRKILKVIGKEASLKGIIEVAEMPAAIQALRTAVDNEANHKHDIDEEHIVQAHAHEEVSHQDHLIHHAVGEIDTVSFKQRAKPFIDMLEHSLAAKKDVVWGV